MAKPSDISNYIYRRGTAPNTRVAVSQKNKVFSFMVGKAGFQQIGAVSEFSHDESRSIEPVRGVGWGDVIAELVPSVTEPMTLTLNKSLLYTVNIFQTVGYKGGVEGLVRSLRHHRWPFDIKQELVFSEVSSKFDYDGVVDAREASLQPGTGLGSGTSTNIITPIQCLFTYFEGCWFTSYNVSYTSDAAIVSETSSVNVTDVVEPNSQYGEYIDSGLAPITANGTAGNGYSARFSTTGQNNQLTL
jgi:hypothetical protein